MVSDGVRIPVPLAHFAWRPMQRRWKEVGNAEFKRDPKRKERKELTDLLLELLLKEQD